MPRVQLPTVTPKRKARNKGRIVAEKRPLLPKQVWAIRARLELAGSLRDVALFNVAIDSKLRGYDLVMLKVSNLLRSDQMRFHVSKLTPERSHISTRQYERLVRDWVTAIGLEPSGYDTHSLRRTKVAEI